MSRSQPALLKCHDRIYLATLLGVKVSTLNYYSYGSGKKYNQFEIPKKSGGTRVISAPVGGLNNIQKKLAVLLNEVYSSHPAAHGFISTKSILSNASQHLNKKCVLNIDLKDFFPAITATRIIGLLKSNHFGLGNEVASTIAALCTYNNRLPQGAPTSPVISNMICYRLDRELTALSKKERVTYTRYADDITFSTTRPKFSKSFTNSVIANKVVLGDYLEAIIENNHFQVNQKKVRIRSGTKAKFVTGVKVNLKPNLSRNYVRQLRSMVHSWEHFGLENAQSEFESEYSGRGRSFENVVLGKLAHLKQIKGHDDLVYRRLYNRVLVQQGKYDEVLPESEIEDLLHRIFVIDSGSQYGTGFILDSKWLVTCAHVVITDEVKFFHYDKAILPEQYHGAKKVKEWISPVNEFDIAALPVENGIINGLNVLNSAPTTVKVQTGDECRVVGFPKYYLGAVPSVTDVKVTKVERNKYGTYDAYVDRTLVSGNSGGPVLNSSNQVIGIVRTGAPEYDDSQGFGSTFLPIQEIRRCLSKFDS